MVDIFVCATVDDRKEDEGREDKRQDRLIDPLFVVTTTMSLHVSLLIALFPVASVLSLSILP